MYHLPAAWKRDRKLETKGERLSNRQHMHQPCVQYKELASALFPVFFRIPCSVRLLSYLFQVEAAHRCNIDAGSQGAHQGGHHAQQCVPHGFAVIRGCSCSEVKDQDEVRCKRPVEASYILQSPAPHPPPPVSSSLFPSYRSPVHYKNSLALTHRHANQCRYTTGTCGWRRGRWGEKKRESGYIIGFFLTPLPFSPFSPFSRLLRKYSCMPGRSKQLFGKSACFFNVLHVKRHRIDDKKEVNCGTFAEL